MLISIYKLIYYGSMFTSTAIDNVRTTEKKYCFIPSVFQSYAFECIYQPADGSRSFVNMLLSRSHLWLSYWDHVHCA